MVARVHELVEPARCRIWDGHNRDYSALNELTCADLIESMKAQGRQEVPAIVRRVVGDADVDFEVICGARRHWAVSWMRKHDYPEFRFLVESREMTDEEAFRVSDLENRSRKDLSDFERAADYLRALDRYYDGNQSRMAKQLRVSESWLSRYLGLARLPQDILRAFSSPHVIGISHAAILAPLLKNVLSRNQLGAAAVAVRAKQQRRQEMGSPLLGPSQVLAELLASHRRLPKARQRAVVKNGENKVVASAERRGAGPIVVTIPAKFDYGQVLDAVGDLLKQLA